MPEEAFALSPISARPNVPGEADYDAIREAFMETARGRWFLNEYAKRNRHTDTGMVMEAVARIEASLKAEKQAPKAVSLSDALGAIRTAIRQAKATAIESLPRPEADDTLTAAHNGARIVREIAWTLRECGADARICDLLDTQVKAIEAGQQNANSDGRETVLASYDLLMQRIEQLVDGSATSAKAETPPATEKPVPPAAEARASVTPLFKAPEPVVEQAVAPKPAEAAAPIAESTTGIAAIIAEVSLAQAVEEVAIAEPGISETEISAPETAALDAEAHDLAVLDLVAMEMAVQDFSEPETAELEIDEPVMDEPEISGLHPAETEVTPTYAAPAATSAAIASAPAVQIAAVVPEPQPELAYHPSLGAALIANGVISNPNAPAADPLAPIRRMTQAEKIAFFS
ncbi:hypothetical protein [Tardiphaga sp.]|uniref:hypothetical protein n=1 Tax=Tardiphaga sp. TaxID=1926292 RepID=UPI00261B1F95|nr:hypothetical protein [Tardiphaga sp.]MDB5620230.1 hypothetical protein [Tardiphaga sp.]